MVKMERGVLEEWLRWREGCWKSFFKMERGVLKND